VVATTRSRCKASPQTLIPNGMDRWCRPLGSPLRHDPRRLDATVNFRHKHHQLLHVPAVHQRAQHPQTSQPYPAFRRGLSSTTCSASCSCVFSVIERYGRRKVMTYSAGAFAFRIAMLGCYWHCAGVSAIRGGALH